MYGATERNQGTKVCGKTRLMARAIVPSHTLLDGDLVFAAATGVHEVDPVVGVYQIGHAAAVCLARAIARGVFLARAVEGDLQPVWSAG